MARAMGSHRPKPSTSPGGATRTHHRDGSPFVSPKPRSPHPETRAPEGPQTKPRSGARTLTHGASHGFASGKTIHEPRRGGDTPHPFPQRRDYDPRLDGQPMPISPPLRGSSIPSWSVQPTAHAVGYGSTAPPGLSWPSPGPRRKPNSPSSSPPKRCGASSRWCPPSITASP